MKSRPCRFSFLSRRHIPVERQREQEKARLSPSVQDRQNMRLNGQKMQCVHSFFTFPDFRKLIYSSVDVYWASLSASGFIMFLSVTSDGGVEEIDTSRTRSSWSLRWLSGEKNGAT